ncbi:MAG: hypothetical protein Q4F83_02985 [Eubacteriales bacterium]|nr:hypothetical protein [Eubacteriales bacterium]
MGHWTSNYRTYHYDRSKTHYRTGDYRTVNYADTYNSSTYRTGSYRTVNTAPVRKCVTVADSRGLREALKKLGKGKSYDYLMIKTRGDGH